jgi:surface protein
MQLIDMLCMMCILKGLVHLICCYFVTLICYFAASYITQAGMFLQASYFNGDISKWDTSSATSFVSQ